MRGIRRLLLLAGLAVVAFAFALGSLGQEAQLGCALDAPADPAFAAELIGTPSTGQGVYHVSLTRHGEPVRGAHVCLNAEMTGMSAMGISDDAVEIDPGVYEVEMRFEMAGPWDGEVLVNDGEGDPIAVPLSFSVKE